MKRAAIAAVWVVVLIVDGVVLPGLTGLHAGLGIMIFLAALAVSFGAHRWVIGLGMALSLGAELILGMNFGVIIGAWLAIIWSWYGMSQVLSMKSVHENDSMLTLVPCAAFGIVLVAVGECAAWLIDRVMYQAGLTSATLRAILGSPAIMGVAFVELVAVLFIFRFIYSSRTSFYA